MIKPNLFIVGAPKAGTTSLWFYLNQHKDIHMSDPKEPNFFNTDLSFDSRIDIGDYLNLFKNPEKKKFYGEASPLYLYSKEAPKRIREFNPDARIIIILRNPAEQMFSCYRQNRLNLIENQNSFVKALEMEKSRKLSNLQSIRGQPIQRLFYHDLADYYSQVKSYLNVFKKEQILIILFDDLKNNELDTLTTIFDFLEVENSSISDISAQKTAKSSRSIIIQKFIHNPPNIIRRIGRVLLQKKLRAKIFRTLTDFNRVKSNKKISAECIYRLNKSKEDEIRLLSGLISRDLSNWLLTTEKSNVK